MFDVGDVTLKFQTNETLKVYKSLMALHSKYMGLLLYIIEYASLILQ